MIPKLEIMDSRQKSSLKKTGIIIIVLVVLFLGVGLYMRIDNKRFVNVSTVSPAEQQAYEIYVQSLENQNPSPKQVETFLKNSENRTVSQDQQGSFLQSLDKR